MHSTEGRGTELLVALSIKEQAGFVTEYSACRTSRFCEDVCVDDGKNR